MYIDRGVVLQEAFNLVSKNARVTLSTLAAGLALVDIVASEEDMIRM
jgi:hypothetical protein